MGSYLKEMWKMNIFVGEINCAVIGTSPVISAGTLTAHFTKPAVHLVTSSQKVPSHKELHWFTALWKEPELEADSSNEDRFL